jgi:murein DD-endopeptidase MepM/ murein hydrolase activator NlpD
MSLSDFEKFLKSIQPHSLLNPDIKTQDYIPLDLSVNNAELEDVDVSSSDDLELFIWNYMKLNQAKVAYGGYLEHRGIYERSDYFNQENADTERSIHLGLDLWIEAKSPIYAPLNGVVHSFNNNTNYGDYGPTIILKHSLENFEFYTLYGHLSLESLEELKIGVEMKQGDEIATLGAAAVNGDYPPHLHFQIIKDIQDFQGDYPGVSNKLQLEFFKQNCPDPNLLLKLI